ncbi:MAG: hypothetical protein KAR17_00775, partial [Cyclobacteriaceae bacterium]|nr:hypothetical protein [Cyclobacteriaceae bacterium]
MPSINKKVQILHSPVLLFLITWLLFTSCTNHPERSLVDQFRNPPNETKPWVYWYWINEQISKEGITLDLEAMARVGIGEALIGHVSPDTTQKGVAMLSDEWWGMIKHAVAEGQRLGVNIGFFNSPGWSQSGGPWIDEDQAMRYIVSKEIHLKGPQNFKGEIPFHEDNFRDIALLAFPAPKDDAYKLSDAELKITSNPSIASLVNLVDGDTVSACVFPEIIGIEDSVIIDLDFNKPVNFQTLILHPIHAPFQVSVELQMKNGTKKFTTIKKIRFDRRRIMPNIGPLLYPPLTSSLPQVTSTQFRLIFSEFETYGKG